MISFFLKRGFRRHIKKMETRRHGYLALRSRMESSIAEIVSMRAKLPVERRFEMQMLVNAFRKRVDLINSQIELIDEELKEAKAAVISLELEC